jgi:hypothetical protein
MKLAQRTDFYIIPAGLPPLEFQPIPSRMFVPVGAATTMLEAFEQYTAILDRLSLIR